MSDLTERISRRLHRGFLRKEPAGETAADVANMVLATLREPSEAMTSAGYDAIDRHAPGAPVDDAWRAMLRQFAREHGLEIPAPPRQEPREGRSGDGTVSGASDAENAPGSPWWPPAGRGTVSDTYVCDGLTSLDEAVAKAARGDKIITLFPEGEGHPALGFTPATGRWHIASWSVTQPCGCWTVDANGKATCRVPQET